MVIGSSLQLISFPIIDWARTIETEDAEIRILQLLAGCLLGGLFHGGWVLVKLKSRRIG